MIVFDTDECLGRVFIGIVQLFASKGKCTRGSVISLKAKLEICQGYHIRRALWLFYGAKYNKLSISIKTINKHFKCKT